MTEGKDLDSYHRLWQARPDQRELDLALGFMVRHAATLEFFLHQTVRRLVGGQFAPLVTAGMQASSLLDAAKRIIDAGAVPEKAAEEMTAISARCRAAFKERNKYVHGVRVIGASNSEVWTNNRRNGLVDQHPLEVENLMKLGADFARLSGQVSEWSRRVLDGEPKRWSRDQPPE
ncbi:hypothetical protein ACFQ7A_26070 [Streptomyces sp. NPDC056528]|uniref:hypothetical protein n=1 Tax=Streptomyces sp. NPDC056528 TaxID=3345854 RepID=UPI003691C3BB